MAPASRLLAVVPKALHAMIGGPDDSDIERGQAVNRLVVVVVVTLYIVVGTISTLVPTSRATTALLMYMILAMIASVLLYTAVMRSPGVNHPRRWLAMAHDYTGITFTMTVGGQVLLPVYAVLLWVTVGNGLRYGPHYLAAATCLALLSLSVTAYLSPFWSENPHIVATLVVTAIIVPAYAYLLLTQTRQARDEAAAANLAKSRFLAQASHDLRQPIHAISLFTACLRDTGLGPDGQQMVDNIDRSLDGVSRLFRSLLDISTLDSGNVRPRTEVVAIGELLQDIADQNSEAARWAGVTIKLVPTSRHVRVDPSLITTIVQNIVSNALKYAPGSPVLIGCRLRGKTLSIAVYDRGRGIPDRDRARVFEEFYRVTVPGRDIEGVGLGLSIVRRVTNLMGLAVSIRSRVGQGTAVIIEGLQITANEKSSPSFRRSRPVTLLGGMHVLLIEDDKDVLLATTTLLEKWGCSVQPELSVPAKIASCDLIITDFDLNGSMTGGASIERVRRLLGHNVPAVVMTGHDENRVRQDLGDAEIPVLSKPVRPAELRATLMAQKLRTESSISDSGTVMPAAPRCVENDA